VCGSTVSGLRKYIKHVGRHLEQLALFALPSLEEQSQAEDAASDEQISAQSSLDVSLKSSSQSDSSMLERRRMPLPGEEEYEENASSTGDNNSIQEAYFVQARAEKQPETLGSTSENSKDIGNSAVMQNISMAKEDETKVVYDKLAWSRSRITSIVDSNMELVERTEMEARHLKSSSAQGPSWKYSIRLGEKTIQIVKQVADELNSFSASYGSSVLSPEEATQLLETLNDSQKKFKTMLKEVELSLRSLKAKGMDQTEVSHAEDANEMTARLADLEGEVPDSTESSAYIQPITKLATMTQWSMALRKREAVLREANAAIEEESARIKEAIVRREKEIATKRTGTPLPTREYEAKIGPKQPLADATESSNLEDDKPIAQVREEKSDSPSRMTFAE
jgi:hypothetical protein